MLSSRPPHAHFVSTPPGLSLHHLPPPLSSVPTLHGLQAIALIKSLEALMTRAYHQTIPDRHHRVFALPPLLLSNDIVFQFSARDALH
ncbi:hypothetical protein C8J57DRAFT_1505993 [Mycena rebaudengoi]|nr:hypothetical protein C8J57DRAFT_1505993 [Mycena rebaudengoi]